MFLSRLQIDAMPGIEPGFTFEPPGEGVTIVTGPNAVGKSSLARALGYLLRDARNDDPPGLLLSADLYSDTARWTVRRTGSQILWTRDGEATSRPSLPSGEQLGLYRLSVENLLASDGTDKELARELRRQLRGGFDLQALRVVLGTRFARNEEKALRGATAELNKVEQRYAHLQREETQLSELSEKIERAEAAREEMQHLRLAISLRDSVAEVRHCTEILGNFPKELEALRGDELKQLDALEQKRAHLKKQFEGQKHSLDSQRRALQATGLQRTRPDAEAMRTVERQLRQLAEKLIAWESAQESVTKAEAERRYAFKQLGGTDKAPKLDRESLSRIEEVAVPLLDTRRRCNELEERIKRADTAPEEHEIERVQQGADALRDWLASRQRRDADAAPRERRMVRIGLRVGLFAALLAVVAAGIEVLPGPGAAVAPGFYFVLLALIGAALAAGSTLVALLANRRLAFEENAAEHHAQNRFDQSGMEPPRAWAAAAVREHLRMRIEKDLQALQLGRERAAERASLEYELETAREWLRELEGKCAALAEDLELDPTLPLLDYQRFANLCVRLDEAGSAWERQKAQSGQLAESIKLLVGSITVFLNKWGRESVMHPEAVSTDETDARSWIGEGPRASATRLQSAFDSLRDRVEQAKTAIAAIENAETEVGSGEKQIAEAAQEIERIYGRAGVQPGQREELAGIVDRLDDWRKARVALEQALGSERRPREQLCEHTELIELAEAGATVELQIRLDNAERRAEEYADLLKQRSSLETRLRDAGRDAVLEKAIAAEANARETLAGKRDEAFLGRATDLLLDDVETELHSEHEPDVLVRAKALFAEATGHEFALNLLPDDSFVAHDNKQGQLREVDKLSSGTRMQLLLALRLAWTEAQEQGGESLPLFLDEALTTSDEGRFKVIAESLERLAEARNRQIFYLAARQHEAALWRASTGRQPPVVNLAEVRFAQNEQTPAAYRIETPPPPPAPEGCTSEEYAALLRVPRIDPSLPAASVHLFHLLRDDLIRLHHLLDGWRIRSLGQLESLLAGNAAADALPEEQIRQRLSLRCTAFRTWVELWRQGRGNPVGRVELERSGAVSGAFIDAAANLADELNGDGRAIVNALREGRLKGFRSAKTNDLETWMQAHEFFDDRPILLPDSLLRLTVQRLAPATDADLEDINKVMDWFVGDATDGAKQQLR